MLPLAISVLGEQQIPLGTIGVLSRSVGRFSVDATYPLPACNDCDDNIYLERLSQVLRELLGAVIDHPCSLMPFEPAADCSAPHGSASGLAEAARSNSLWPA
jgi:hypothetical protein